MPGPNLAALVDPADGGHPTPSGSGQPGVRKAEPVSGPLPGRAEFDAPDRNHDAMEPAAGSQQQRRGRRESTVGGHRAPIPADEDNLTKVEHVVSEPGWAPFDNALLRNELSISPNRKHLPSAVERLLTVAEAAEISQTNEKTVRRWIASRKLRAIWLGRLLRIREPDWQGLP